MTATELNQREFEVLHTLELVSSQMLILVDALNRHSDALTQYMEAVRLREAGDQTTRTPAGIQ